ncbi:HAD-IIA family hydrolase [Oscillospiraceae bacterium NSJ-54]|uniref:Acid sugar phosphatase n=1 Tax=Zongyangia hominis TaxID=2763677 RepID=A0A926ECL6_9FIRM|nr:HAD-IIA family hydrolase [Zongyangia hominis]
MNTLENIRMFLLDMDGTFYLGNQIFPCSYAFVEKMKETGRDFLFLTNNSSKDRFAYREKLARMGFDVAPERIFTSGEATTLYLQDAFPGKRVFLVGTDSLTREFEQAGIPLVEEDPELVVLGFDTALTYDKLWKLCDFVRAGLPYIATHPDFNCPIETGYMPDIGATIAFVEASTGRRPKVIGKPHKEIVDAILQKVGLPREQIAMVGDRLYTDIAMGQNAGITSILVLSGETTLEDLKTSDVRPNFIFKDLGELAEHLGPLPR